MQVMVLFAFIATGCNVKTGKFSVPGNTAVDQGQVQPTGSQSVKNLIACVHWLRMRKYACYGDFDKMSKICNIFTSACCDLNTEQKIGVYTFKRNLKGKFIYISNVHILSSVFIHVNSISPSRILKNCCEIVNNVDACFLENR